MIDTSKYKDNECKRQSDTRVSAIKQKIAQQSKDESVRKGSDNTEISQFQPSSNANTPSMQTKKANIKEETGILKNRSDSPSSRKISTRRSDTMVQPESKFTYKPTFAKSTSMQAPSFDGGDSPRNLKAQNSIQSNKDYKNGPLKQSTFKDRKFVAPILQKSQTSQKVNIDFNKNFVTVIDTLTSSVKKINSSAKDADKKNFHFQNGGSINVKKMERSPKHERKRSIVINPDGTAIGEFTDGEQRVEVKQAKKVTVIKLEDYKRGNTPSEIHIAIDKMENKNVLNKLNSELRKKTKAIGLFDRLAYGSKNHNDLQAKQLKLVKSLSRESNLGDLAS